jgi:hypothetical protein
MASANAEGGACAPSIDLLAQHSRRAVFCAAMYHGFLTVRIHLARVCILWKVKMRAEMC